MLHKRQAEYKTNLHPVYRVSKEAFPPIFTEGVKCKLWCLSSDPQHGKYTDHLAGASQAAHTHLPLPRKDTAGEGAFCKQSWKTWH